MSSSDIAISRITGTPPPGPTTGNGGRLQQDDASARQGSANQRRQTPPQVQRQTLTAASSTMGDNESFHSQSPPPPQSSQDAVAAASRVSPNASKSRTPRGTPTQPPLDGTQRPVAVETSQSQQSNNRLDTPSPLSDADDGPRQKPSRPTDPAAPSPTPQSQPVSVRDEWRKGDQVVHRVPFISPAQFFSLESQEPTTSVLDGYPRSPAAAHKRFEELMNYRREDEHGARGSMTPSRAIAANADLAENETVLYHIDNVSVKIWGVGEAPSPVPSRGASPGLNLRSSDSVTANWLAANAKTSHKALPRHSPTVTSQHCLLSVSSQKVVIFCYERGTVLETIFPVDIAQVRAQSVAANGRPDGPCEVFIAAVDDSNARGGRAGGSDAFRSPLGQYKGGAGGGKLSGCSWNSIMLRVDSNEECDQIMNAFGALKARYIGAPTKQPTHDAMERAIILQHEARSLLASLGIRPDSDTHNVDKDARRRAAAKRRQVAAREGSPASPARGSDIGAGSDSEVEDYSSFLNQFSRPRSPRTGAISPAATSMRTLSPISFATPPPQQGLTPFQRAAMTPTQQKYYPQSMSQQRSRPMSPSMGSLQEIGLRGAALDPREFYGIGYTGPAPLPPYTPETERDRSTSIDQGTQTPRQVIVHEQPAAIVPPPQQQQPPRIQDRLQELPKPDLNLCRWCQKPCAPEHIPRCAMRLIVCPICLDEQATESPGRNPPPSAILRAIEYDSHTKHRHPEHYKRMLRERDRSPSGRSRHRRSGSEAESEDSRDFGPRRRSSQMDRARAILDGLDEDQRIREESARVRREERHRQEEIRRRPAVGPIPVETETRRPLERDDMNYPSADDPGNSGNDSRENSGSFEPILRRRSRYASPQRQRHDRSDGGQSSSSADASRRAPSASAPSRRLDDAASVATVGSEGAPSASGEEGTNELKQCKWCGKKDFKEHEKKCAKRRVKCKLCGEEFRLGDRVEHRAHCTQRPPALSNSQ